MEELHNNGVGVWGLGTLQQPKELRTDRTVCFYVIVNLLLNPTELSILSANRHCVQYEPKTVILTRNQEVHCSSFATWLFRPFSELLEEIVILNFGNIFPIYSKLNTMNWKFRQSFSRRKSPSQAGWFSSQFDCFSQFECIKWLIGSKKLC